MSHFALVISLLVFSGCIQNSSHSKDDVRVSHYCYGDSCNVIIEEGDLGPSKLEIREVDRVELGSSDESRYEPRDYKRTVYSYPRPSETDPSLPSPDLGDSRGLPGTNQPSSVRLPRFLSEQQAQDLKNNVNQRSALPRSILNFNAKSYEAGMSQIERELKRFDLMHAKAFTQPFLKIDRKYRWKKTSEVDHPYVTAMHSPEGQRLNRAHKYVQHAKERISNSQDFKSERSDLIHTAELSLREADSSFQRGDIQEGDVAVGWAETLADTALALTPGIGWAKDVFESVSGSSLVTGNKLSTFERSAAIFGAASFGLGSKIALGAKVFKKIVTRTAKAVKGTSRMADASRGLDEAVEVVQSSASITRHGPLNPGVLHTKPIKGELLLDSRGFPVSGSTVADTFRGGTYNTVVTSEPTFLYRAYSDPARKYSPYWSRVKPTGPVQATVDSALAPSFHNKATNWVKIEVGSGTTLHEGVVGKIDDLERGAALLGGGDQVFLNNIRITKEMERGTGVFE